MVKNNGAISANTVAESNHFEENESVSLQSITFQKSTFHVSDRNIFGYT